MRKVMAAEYVTLDGVMEAPEKWHSLYFDDEMGEAIEAEMAASDAMLLGRVTYQEFASFCADKTSDDARYADRINSMPKYVASTTLEESLEWRNSTLIEGDIVEEIAYLKQQPGKDISNSGSGTLVRSLMRANLIDEYRLMVHPGVLGSGKRLFEDEDARKPLDLVDSRTFGSGVGYLTYRSSDEQDSRLGARGVGV